MDVFFEQLITIKKDIKTYLAYIGIAISAILLMTVSLMLSRGLAVIVIFLVFWGAYKLYSMFNIEYEYIITNSTMDIDKITARSSRKRIVSIKLNEVEEFGVYSQQKANALANRNFSCRFICCNSGDEAYYLTYNHPKKGMILLILAMNERTKSEAMKTIPRIALSD